MAEPPPKLLLTPFWTYLHLHAYSPFQLTAGVLQLLPRLSSSHHSLLRPASLGSTNPIVPFEDLWAAMWMGQTALFWCLNAVCTMVQKLLVKKNGAKWNGSSLGHLEATTTRNCRHAENDGHFQKAAMQPRNVWPALLPQYKVWSSSKDNWGGRYGAW